MCPMMPRGNDSAAMQSMTRRFRFLKPFLVSLLVLITAARLASGRDLAVAVDAAATMHFSTALGDTPPWATLPPP